MNKSILLIIGFIYLGCVNSNSQKFNLKKGIFIEHPTQHNIGVPFVVSEFKNGVIDSLFINISDTVKYYGLKSFDGTTIIAMQEAKRDKRYRYCQLVLINRSGQVLKKIPGLNQERILDYQISNDNRYVVKLVALDTNNDLRPTINHRFYIYDMERNLNVFVSDSLSTNDMDLVLKEGAFCSNNKLVVFAKINGPKINIPGYNKPIESSKSIKNGIYIIDIDMKTMRHINYHAIGASWSPVDSNQLLYFNRDSVCLYDVKLQKLIHNYTAKANRHISNFHWLPDGKEFVITEYYRKFGMPFNSYEQKAINLHTKKLRIFKDFYLGSHNSYRW